MSGGFFEKANIMKPPPKKAGQTVAPKHKKSVAKKVSRIKVQYDKELDTLSGSIIFPEKLASANKFLKKSA